MHEYSIASSLLKLAEEQAAKHGATPSAAAESKASSSSKKGEGGSSAKKPVRFRKATSAESSMLRPADSTPTRNPCYNFQRRFVAAVARLQCVTRRLPPPAPPFLADAR